MPDPDNNSRPTPPPQESVLADRPDNPFDLIIRAAMRLRFINLIAVDCSFVGALCMSTIALIKTWWAVKATYEGVRANDAEMPGKVTGYVVQAMDAFLISVVLVVFATGIFHLFIKQLDSGMLMNLRGFKIMSSINDLKKIIAELIIVVLFVQFLKLALDEKELAWTALVIPAGILTMAIALRLLRLDHGRDTDSVKAQPPTATNGLNEL